MSGAPDAPPRRFYKAAGVKAQDGAFALTLDERTLRTPKKALFLAPTHALAAAAAAEWDAQHDVIRADTMPVTRLINVALDFAPGARAEMAAAVARYGQTDLLSHRAARPANLARRQQEAWDPLLAWADETLGAALASGTGILALAQPPAALDALARRARALDDFRLTGVAHAAGLAGSAIIAFALAHGRLDVDQAFEAAALDELHQIETWGEDREARKRLDHLKGELAALTRFFAALA